MIDKIEEVFEQIADAMLNDKNEFSITLKTRRRAASKNQQRDGDEDRTKRLCFPGKTANEAWRFGKHCIHGSKGISPDLAPAVVIRILELMHEALRNDVVMSKRSISHSSINCKTLTFAGTYTTGTRPSSAAKLMLTAVSTRSESKGVSSNAV